MAASDYARSPRSSFSKRHSNAPPSLVRNDWTATDEPPLPDSPRWRRRREDIEPYEFTAPSPPGRSPFNRPRPPPSSMSMHAPDPAIPGLTRTVTVPVRRPTFYYEEEDRSRSDSRRSGSRRDRSPPSAHLYRSTPDSVRSSRTSVTDNSDQDTDATASTRDETERKPSPTKLLRAPQPPRRRTSSRAPRRAKVIYQEDNDDRPSRYGSDPFLERPRSLSRPSTDRRSDHRRARTDIGPRDSFEESRSRSRSNRYGKISLWPCGLVHFRMGEPHRVRGCLRMKAMA